MLNGRFDNHCTVFQGSFLKITKFSFRSTLKNRFSGFVRFDWLAREEMLTKIGPLVWTWRRSSLHSFTIEQIRLHFPVIGSAHFFFFENSIYPKLRAWLVLFQIQRMRCDGTEPKFDFLAFSTANSLEWIFFYKLLSTRSYLKCLDLWCHLECLSEAIKKSRKVWESKPTISLETIHTTFLER